MSILNNMWNIFNMLRIFHAVLLFKLFDYNKLQSHVMVLSTRTLSYNVSEFGALKALDESFKRVEIESLTYFYNARCGIQRIFWLLLTSFFSIVMAYEIFRTISDYVESPVSNSFKILTFDEIPLPQVYICPNYRFTQQALTMNRSLLINLLELNEKLSSRSIGGKTEPTNNSETVDWLHYDGYNWDNATFRDLKNQWFNVTNVKSLYYRTQLRKTITQLSDLETDKKIYVFDRQYGICMLANLNGYNQEISDVALYFFLLLNQSIFQTKNHNLSNVPVFRGFYVSVADRIDPTNIDNGFIVPVGFFTRFVVKKRNVTRLKTGNSCSEKTGTEFQILNATYSIKSCKLDCLLSSFFNICHCLPGIDEFFLRRDKSMNFCTVTQLKSCQNDNNWTYIQEIRKIDCDSMCIMPCNFVTYSLSSSMNIINKDSFDDYNGPNPLWLDMALLKIAYSQLEVESFTASVSMSVDDVISNIGGQVNLWLGMSMFTIIQIPAILTFVFCFKLHHKYMMNKLSTVIRDNQFGMLTHRKHNDLSGLQQKSEQKTIIIQKPTPFRY